ncbi:S41 family peptidase [Parasphingopyxis lamellibrachiae]|uniref:C-terminal processing protease CtpA/Prc n=1 Tax=Parasphingopyxis lamellibrachiae TaxID=680125 RepID=A0A3D9FDK2_9SPHN|nr:S41 family peptidase [Parasphingopyxis lamellibrachiae]RED15859.1 C-terminal processing protease CtpA/Prc [Parasphingopyxis lamellibrachiae]
MMKSRFRSIALIVMASMFFGEAALAQIDAHHLQTDVEAWRHWMGSTHPDLSHSADAQLLDAAFESLEQGFQGEYDSRTAWYALATINPLLNDAHSGIRLPDTAYEAAIERGAAAFTLPVRVTDGRLFVAGNIQPSSPLNPDEEILAVNGQPAATLVTELEPRMRGESSGLRERVLSLRFPIALWALQGDRQFHNVTVERDDGPETIGLDPTRDIAVSDSGVYALDIRGPVAVMRVDSFEAPREEEFATFLSDAFARIDAGNIDRLIVDLRGNGGGARQLSDRLMAYITTARYTPISAVKARIVAENQALIPGSQIGQVIDMPFAQWAEPPVELDHRFEGTTVILIGPTSYSQTIAFAVTVQDFEIAEIAGTPTEGPANQTGQVQRFTLPETGLVVQAPLYIFTRPSGEAGRAPLVPDRLIPGQGQEQLAALIAALDE